MNFAIVRSLLDAINFFYDHCQLLCSVLILTWLAVYFHKFIKQKTIYIYIFFSLVAALFLFNFLNGYLHFTEWNMRKDAPPFVNKLVSEMVHMVYMGHPLFIIIMFMGALDTKTRWVAKLMSIRKELSIIVGFPVITHFIVRFTRTFWYAVDYFADKEAYLAQMRRPVHSELGLTLTNLAYLLGLLMFIVFIVLWITSFDKVRKKMGQVKWKKVQRWAYVLYGMIFIHALFLNLGRLLNANPESEHYSEMVWRWGIAIATLIIIYGSYLFLRIRKAKRDKAKKNAREMRHSIADK